MSWWNPREKKISKREDWATIRNMDIIPLFIQQQWITAMTWEFWYVLRRDTFYPQRIHTTDNSIQEDEYNCTETHREVRDYQIIYL